jgi:hypothetical protein
VRPFSCHPLFHITRHLAGTTNDSLPPLNAAPLVKELERVAFARLLPGNLHRRDGVDVQALDLGELNPR